MSIEIRQLHPVFMGEVSGVDLSRPLTREEAATLEAGMDRYAVLVFHDQEITDQQQMDFGRNFGRLGRDNKPLARDDRKRLFNLGNRLWHSDSSFRAIPAKFSLLSARTVATSGGNTEFADMRAAYDALDEATKAECEDLICEHSLLYSRGALGFTELAEDEKAMFRPVRQRLVRTHPVTGRKSLYLASHIGTIIGWPMPEARAFIRDLTEHATQREFVYAHKWRQYDLVMWDNRQTMHRVRRYDEREIRDMRRTTVAGTAPTVEQEVAA
jgi:alpha-ketoglutarate-dependent 2,4-dichlorophenoxyacetate dioxygenase